MSIANNILSFNNSLSIDELSLPEGIEVLNPFRGANSEIISQLTSSFYHRYYNDNVTRTIIFGINPGRMGAGLTGIPFTDTECLEKKCSISAQGIETRETSATFFYEMIEAYGDPTSFYARFFIGATSPLGFVKLNDKGRYVNYNYYDQLDLQNLLLPKIKQWFVDQFNLGMSSERAFCLGTGKNYRFLKKLNSEMKLFSSITPLEHPRYIMQYRNKQKQVFIQKYLRAFDF